MVASRAWLAPWYALVIFWGAWYSTLLNASVFGDGICSVPNFRLVGEYWSDHACVEGPKSSNVLHLYHSSGGIGKHC